MSLQEEITSTDGFFYDHNKNVSCKNMYELGLYVNLSNQIFVGTIELAISMQIFTLIYTFCCSKDISHLIAKNDDPMVVVYMA